MTVLWNQRSYKFLFQRCHILISTEELFLIFETGTGHDFQQKTVAWFLLIQSVVFRHSALSEKHILSFFFHSCLQKFPMFCEPVLEGTQFGPSGLREDRFWRGHASVFLQQVYPLLWLIRSHLCYEEGNWQVALSVRYPLMMGVTWRWRRFPYRRHCPILTTKAHVHRRRAILRLVGMCQLLDH